MLLYIITVVDADMCYERMLTTIMLMILRLRHHDLWVRRELGSNPAIPQHTENRKYCWCQTHKKNGTIYLFIYLSTVLLTISAAQATKH
jgi:hypothetical protein